MSSSPKRPTLPARSGRRTVGAPPARPPTPPTKPTEGIRLQKVLAAAGIASRRAAEEMIVAGRVRVDGTVVRVLGTRVDPTKARIEVDGRRIGLRTDREYVLVNKPAGVVTTARDPQRRPIVIDLVPGGRRLFPVGRLDADTCGLLLLTDDGELSHRLAHPRYGVEKTYLARVAGRVVAETLRRLERGVSLDDGPARAVRARVRRSTPTESQVEIVMREGRKREVRRMLDAVGHPVVELVRTEFGPLRIGGLASGRHRRLTPAEVGELYRMVGL